MNFIFITAREKPKKTESSVLSVFIFRFSVFFGFLKTDVGIGFGFSKYRDISVRFSVYRPKTNTFTSLLNVLHFQKRHYHTYQKMASNYLNCINDILAPLNLTSYAETSVNTHAALRAALD
jgi:hypothetical protein